MSLSEHRFTPAEEAALAIEQLVREHYAYIRRVALSILDDPDEADDAAQEAFIAAHRALAEFRGQSQSRTWLTSIVVNGCRDRLRRRRVREAMSSVLGVLQSLVGRRDDPEQAALDGESRRQVWAAVDALDEKHRLPVILRYVHGLSVPEIAAALTTGEGTIHSRLHYARRKLQDRLSTLFPREEAPHGPDPR